MRDWLDQGEHIDEVLAGIDRAGGSLEAARFEACTLEGWSLAEATLRDCVFDDCTFQRCDLTMAKLYDSRFRGVRFERCKLMGVDFTAAYALGFDVAFDGCVLSYASFLGMKLKALEAIACKARETIFDEADLREAIFTDTDLSGARFGGADLRGADLGEAIGYAIDPAFTKVKGTKMSIDGALASARLVGIEVPALG